MIDILIDFSALSTMACARKYQLTCTQGLDSSSPETSWGSAFHKFVEARGKGNLDDIITFVPAIASEFRLKPPEATKLISVCMQFDSQFNVPVAIKDNDRQLLVEWKFNFPYMTTEKYRIILCGTVDLVYPTPANDWLVFRDYKTTAKASGLDDQLAEYMASFQIPFYLYALQHHLAKFLAEPYAELASQGRLSGEYFMVYKSFLPAKFKTSSPVLAWPKEDIEAVLHPLIAKAIAVNDLTTLAPAEGTATRACKSCPYFHICLTRDAERRTNMLANFPRRVYNPMEFR